MTEFNGYNLNDCIVVNGFPNNQLLLKLEECLGCGGRKNGKVKFTIQDVITGRKRVVMASQVLKKCD